MNPRGEVRRDVAELVANSDSFERAAKSCGERRHPLRSGNESLCRSEPT